MGKNLRNQTVQRKETVNINENEEVEDDKGEDEEAEVVVEVLSSGGVESQEVEGEGEEVDVIEVVSSGGAKTQEVEGPEPEAKKQKIGKLEGVGSNTRMENMKEIEEIGEAMWDAHANTVILDMEQRTDIQHIKDLLKCFDTKEAGNKSKNFSNTFDKMERCIQPWVNKKKLLCLRVPC